MAIRCPDAEIVALAQAHYGHLWRLLGEFPHFRWLSAARKAALVRIENYEAFAAALAAGQGRADAHRAFRQLGSGDDRRPRATIRRFAASSISSAARSSRAGSTRSSRGASTRRDSASSASADRSTGSSISWPRATSIVFPFDQHAAPPDGIEVEFFGHPAWTFKSLAIIALATGAPVLSATSWREDDGRHVLRFGEPIAPVEDEDTNEAIRRTTRAYNAALERLILARPEQWYWVHRRWKPSAGKSRKRRLR